MSQTEIATFWPGRTRSLSGGRPIGWRSAATSAACVQDQLPGVFLNFTPSPTPVVGTTGRSIDHIGFEVRNLEAFTKQLEAQGIKLDRPYTKIAGLGIAVAFIKDPWGTNIELSEGLDTVK